MQAAPDAHPADRLHGHGQHHQAGQQDHFGLAADVQPVGGPARHDDPDRRWPEQVDAAHKGKEYRQAPADRPGRVLEQGGAAQVEADGDGGVGGRRSWVAY